MRVAVHAGREPGTPALGAPEVVADYRYYSRRTPARFFDAPAAGDRLLLIGSALDDAEHDREIRVVTNWFEELRRIVPLR